MKKYRDALLVIIEHSTVNNIISQAATCMLAIEKGSPILHLRYNICAETALQKPSDFTPNERKKIAECMIPEEVEDEKVSA